MRRLLAFLKILLVAVTQSAEVAFAARLGDGVDRSARLKTWQAAMEQQAEEVVLSAWLRAQRREQTFPTASYFAGNVPDLAALSQQQMDGDSPPASAMAEASAAAAAGDFDDAMTKVLMELRFGDKASPAPASAVAVPASAPASTQSKSRPVPVVKDNLHLSGHAKAKLHALHDHVSDMLRDAGEDPDVSSITSSVQTASASRAEGTSEAMAPVDCNRRCQTYPSALEESARGDWCSYLCQNWGKWSK